MVGHLETFINEHMAAVVARDFDRAARDYGPDSVCHLLSNRPDITGGIGTRPGIQVLDHYVGRDEIMRSFMVVMGWTEHEVGALTPDRLRIDRTFNEVANTATARIDVLDTDGLPLFGVTEWFMVKNGVIHDQGTVIEDLRDRTTGHKYSAESDLPRPA